MKNSSMNEVMKLLNGLSSYEQQELVDKIMLMLNPADTKISKDSCHHMLSENKSMRPDCPQCHSSKNVIKKGTPNGRQRYFCKECGKFFFSTTNTVFAHTRKDADTWRMFILMTITGASLKKCAQKCEIAYQTAFTWRHKILNTLSIHGESTKLTGVIEMDEMLIPISYKGNHVQGHFNEKRKRHEGRVNDMPRKSYKRGSDNKSKSSFDKACVCCMVENGDEKFYASIPGVGFMKDNMLSKVVDLHVKKETAILLVDEYKVTKNYLSSNEYRFHVLKSNTLDNVHDHKPEIQGDFHIQHVNAMHHHIRRFLAQYCGVSSKYLQNYIALYVWLRTMKTKEEETLRNLYVTTASNVASYISRKELDAYPRVPQCA